MIKSSMSSKVCAFLASAFVTGIFPAVSLGAKEIDYAKEASKVFRREITKLPSSFAELSGLIAAPKMKNDVRLLCSAFVDKTLHSVEKYNLALFSIPIDQKSQTSSESIFQDLQSTLAEANRLNPACYTWVANNYIVASAFLLSLESAPNTAIPQAKNAQFPLALAYLINKGAIAAAPLDSEYKEGHRAYLNCATKVTSISAELRPFDLAATAMEQVDQHNRLQAAYLENFGKDAGRLLDKDIPLREAPFAMGGKGYSGLPARGSDWLESFMAESMNASSTAAITQWYVLYKRGLQSSLGRLAAISTKDFSFIDLNGPFQSLLRGPELKEIWKSYLLHYALTHNLQYVAPKKGLVQALLDEPLDSHIGHKLGDSKDRKSLRRRLEKLLASELGDKPAHSNLRYMIFVSIPLPRKKGEEPRTVDINIGGPEEKVAPIMDELIGHFKVSQHIDSQLTPKFIREHLIPIAEESNYSKQLATKPSKELLWFVLPRDYPEERTRIDKSFPIELDRARASILAATLQNYGVAQTAKGRELLEIHPRLSFYQSAAEAYMLGDQSLQDFYYYVHPSKYGKHWSLVPYCRGLKQAVQTGQLNDFKFMTSADEIVRHYPRFEKGL